jgi:hypothetical protein
MTGAGVIGCRASLAPHVGLALTAQCLGPPSWTGTDAHSGRTQVIRTFASRTEAQDFVAATRVAVDNQTAI